MLLAENLSFHYPQGPWLFKDVSFGLAPGERLELRAPSGRGKTTLARILSGYEKPSGGQVVVDGQPLPRKGRQPVQLVGQHPEMVLDPRLRMEKSLHEVGEIDDDLLERLGIRPAWLSRFPHELSGGELQRFCIARALLAQPRYLVADEISTMLDALTQAQIWEVILEEVVTRNLGLLFVSHSPALARRIATDCLELTPA